MPRLLLAVGAFAVLIAAFTLGLGKHGKSAPSVAAHAAATHHVAARPWRLQERPLGQLLAPVQDASAARTAGGFLLLGGLTASDTSSDRIGLVTGGHERQRGHLPGVVHDAAAATLGGAAYLFGGGDLTQFDSILRVEPRTGATSAAGRLPASNSDLSAAVVGGTAYIVGGYTGSRWLDTILAWRPGTAPRVAGRLPTALRYAAVTAVAGKILIAGGSTPAGLASRAILLFDPATGAVRTVSRLPAPTTHAAAAALGQIAYVIGGRGAASNTPNDRIVAVDVPSGRVRLAGRLGTPRSDLAAVAVGAQIVLAGGRGPAGTEATLSKLVPVGSGVASALAVATAPSPKASPAASTTNVYAADGANMFSPADKGDPPRVYVPNSQSNTVDVIDPRTFRIVAHFQVGALPQHVTPAYDLRTLYVLNDQGNSLTPINPRTTRPGRPIPVEDPYNMYFTPDGRYAIVVAERNARLDFRDAHTFQLRHSLAVPCRGVDHMDFSADGSYLIASCEFSGQLIKVDVRTQRVIGVLQVSAGGMPQDVKLTPDGKLFYVADMMANGVWEVNGRSFRVVGFLPTGKGAHGLYPSRDGRYLYVTNRGEGTISVVSFRLGRVVARWSLPGGGSPDMGGVSADGRVLWVSGRWNAEVYAFDTRTGRLLARIPVGSGPHGLSVWPQPGRYSLGHTGILR